MSTAPDERLRRWRLILGADAADATGVRLAAEDDGMDRALELLYGDDRSASLAASNPRVHRWLGDIRKYFPTSTVRVMQRDALQRLDLTQMLLQPELLESVEPDVHLVATLLSRSKVMPQKTRDTARLVVRKVVDDVQRRLAQRTLSVLRGALNRAARTRRPRPRDIDWDRTVRANLRHYLPERRTIVPERLIGFGRRRSGLNDVVLCVDQSGSMAASVVYSGIFAAVLASLPALRTRLVVFDTAVADLTERLSDPVEVLFGTQLGGGTDIHRALSYGETLIDRPARTLFVLISDLFEGGSAPAMIQCAARMIAAGVTFVVLLALNDDGAPAYDAENAAQLAALGAPVFACTPDLFPELIAAAVERRSIDAWAARHNLVACRPAAT